MKVQRKAFTWHGGRTWRRIVRAINSREAFGVLEIATEALATRDSASKVISQMIARGLVLKTREHVAGRGHHGAAEYVLVKKIPIASPAPRARLWRSMRMMRRFTISDLAATAETSNLNTRHYVRDLVLGGYVRRLVRAIPKRGLEGHAVFALVRDTGPHEPRRTVNGSILDPNFGAGGRECRNQSGSRGFTTAHTNRVIKGHEALARASATQISPQ